MDWKKTNSVNYYVFIMYCIFLPFISNQIMRLFLCLTLLAKMKNQYFVFGGFLTTRLKKPFLCSEFTVS